MDERRILVRVDIDGINRTFAYEAPEGTEVGDRVTVPPFYYEPQNGPGHHGTVTAYGADYEGPVRDIIAVTGPAGGLGKSPSSFPPGTRGAAETVRRLWDGTVW